MAERQSSSIVLSSSDDDTPIASSDRLRGMSVGTDGSTTAGIPSGQDLTNMGTDGELPTSAASSTPQKIEAPSSPASPMSRYGSGSPRRQIVPLVIPEALSRIPRSRIKMEDKSQLGEGGFARVVKGQILPEASSGKPLDVAVKIVQRQKALTSAFVNMQLEIDVCALLSHPCIVNTKAVFEDEQFIYIVMDLAPNGELLQYTKRIGLEDMPEVGPKFIAEIILGLEYMQQQGIVHRDIKPENLLLTTEYHVKIADFGTACAITSPENNKMTGTAQYVSPEVINTGVATPTSDIWAVGCCLYQLFVGRPPFTGDSEYLILQSVKAMKYEFGPYFPQEAKDLVQRMLDPDPTKRIGANGFEEIKGHPFFKNVNWETLLQGSNETYLNKDHNKDWEALLLKNERIIFKSRTKKERHFSVKERELILTDFPRLFYVKPGTYKIKGQVPWSDSVFAEAESQTKFNVHTPERIYNFECQEKHAMMWASKINDLARVRRNAPGSPAGKR